MRSVLQLLVRFYPRRFRRQFETELLDSFDDAMRDGSWSAALLLADTAVSVIRQWLRPGIAPPAPSAIGPTGAPLFQLDDYRMGRWAMVDGLLMTLLLLGYLMLLLNPGAQPARVSVGTPDYPAPRLLTVARDTLSASGPRSQVLVPARPTTLADRLQEYAATFFQIPLLNRLDENADYRLSFDEIARAPQVLATFDVDGNGSLTPAELKLSPAAIRILPVARALDADRDFVISATEIRDSALALRRLDLTRDGELGIIEIMPERDFQQRAAEK